MLLGVSSINRDTLGAALEARPCEPWDGWAPAETAEEEDVRPDSSVSER